jgi:tetratricopeptide (TPR) repeat protein
VVDLALDEVGDAPQAASARLKVGLSAQDREDVRWYLEDYLQYPVSPAPAIAARVEARLAELGTRVFTGIFEANRDTIRLWNAIARTLPRARVEVDAGVEGGSAVPWELLRDPATDGVLALRAGAFVRTHPEAAVPVRRKEAEPGALRVLLVICRPGGRTDVPFRSVASHLVRLSRGAREAFQLDVLRPPSFARLAEVLEAARNARQPYHVVHFDGHGAWLDAEAAVAQAPAGDSSRKAFSLVSPPRSGSHGFLVFEDPSGAADQQLVDGPAIGALLAGTGVGVLVLNACRSAHADLVTKPQTETEERDAHQRVRAYGSLAQEVMDAGVAGVVAMAYNVYVVTAANFIGQVYKGLLAGQPLGAAVGGARRQLAADPQRQVGAQPLPLQDWMVPVVYEAAPLTLRTAPLTGGEELSIDLDQAQAGAERVGLGTGLPTGPDVGFFGRDETLLALDRAFDNAPVVLLHAWAGAGKTSTALEFARWYALTAGTQAVLFTSFEHHLTLARLLDQIGSQFGPALERSRVQWATLGDTDRRSVAIQVLAQIPVLWIWDNIEPVTGFPAGAPSAWTAAEQAELLAFLRDLAAQTLCKVLLTSRRDEQIWLGDLPARVALPPMPMLERLELAQAVARRQTGGTQAFLAVEDWRPLLEFTQGNPLTVTILVRQAMRGRYATKQQIEAFVAQLRAGAATITDDATEGRGASLAASLDYGFTQAFTEQERAILALLALFQSFADTNAFTVMGDPTQPNGPLPAVAALTREAVIALLERAAEVGLLTSHGSGYYTVHPAVPWHLHQLFQAHYGPPDSPPALAATHAWTYAISYIGNYYRNLYDAGRTELIAGLGLEEANLLRARDLAIEHHWPVMIIAAMQGLGGLYGLTGRAVEWRRLVTELIPVLTDPATGGPRPGLEEQWAVLTGYRIGVAKDLRQWDTVQQLAQALIAWRRQHAAEALTTVPEQLNETQWTQVHNLSAQLQELGQILREQGDPGCIEPYREAMELAERIGDRVQEARVAFDLGNVYSTIPAHRNLDQAQHWYQYADQLFGEDDTLNRAKTTVQLGNVVYERYRDALDAGAEQETLLRWLNDAASAYQRALNLIPPGAVNELAVAHGALGVIYDGSGHADRALAHHQKAIYYNELQDNTYGAGVIRLNAAAGLARAGRRHDALLFARAALRDFETVGPGAAAKAERTRQLITDLEQEPTK